MASQTNKQENLRKSIFSIQVSKGPRSLPVRKGTASTVKIEGSSSIYLLTCRKVVEHGGASSSTLSCKRFCPPPPQEDEHRINLDSEPLKSGQFGFIPFQMGPHLKLVSVDKLRREGETMRKSTCQSYTFFENSFTALTWEFSNDEGVYVLTDIDPKRELAESACRGSPVVSIDDQDHSVIGVVDCTSEGDLNLVFFEESSLRDIEAELRGRCSDEDGRDVTDLPFIPRDSTPSAPPLENEEGSNIGGNKPEDVGLKDLTRTLSMTGIQETEDSKFPSEKKSEEIICLWDQKLQSLTHFQDLLTTILKINLDPKRQLGGDYQSLAGALGKDMKYIWHLSTQPSPVEALVRDFPSLTLKVLTQLLSSKEVNRSDVVKEITTWVNKKSCNCSKCGSLQ